MDTAIEDDHHAGKPEAMNTRPRAIQDPKGKAGGVEWSLSISRPNIHKQTVYFYCFNTPATVSAASVNRHPLFKKDLRHATLL